MAISVSISAVQNWQDIANNISNVTVTVKYSWDYGSYNHIGAWLDITLNGDSNGGSTVKLNPDRTNSGSDILGTFTANVPHNTDGTKTVYFSTWCDTGTSSETVEASGSLVLTTIPREASIVSAPHFDDEGNPTITYSNPAGTGATILQACIANVGGTVVYVPYRDIPKTGTSYTFELTEAERNALRKATPNSNSMEVLFYVTCGIGNNLYYSTLQRTFSIVNGHPTINPNIVDTNATTIALTGNSSKLVRFYSNAQVATGAGAIKGATLKSQKIVNGSKSLTGNGTISAIDSGTFIFSATDSRGNSSSKTVNQSLVEYVRLSCNITNKTPDTQGNFTFTVTGNYFNSTFGAVANTLNVYYRWKGSGDYSSWAAMTVTKSGNTYTATADLTGLDYQTVYTFQAYAVDKLATVYSEEKPIKSTPVFDWGENDFNFNVPVSFYNSDPIVDFIVEEGETNGWFWRKWNSGIAECWTIYYGFGINAASTNYSGFYYSPTITVDFPFTFSNLPTVIVDGGSNSYMNFVRSFGKYSDGASFVVVGLMEQTSVDITVDIRAIGKWR